MNRMDCFALTEEEVAALHQAVVQPDCGTTNTLDALGVADQELLPSIDLDGVTVTLDGAMRAYEYGGSSRLICEELVRGRRLSGGGG